MTVLDSRTRAVPRRWLAVGSLAAAVVGTVAVYSFSDVGRGEGPLVVSENRYQLASPNADALYFTLHACTEEPTELKITQVDSVGLWDVEGAPTWLVAWPTEPHKVGTGPAPAPRTLFTPVGKDPGGISPGCTAEDRAPLLAAEFPHADATDLGFDRIRVHYTADGDDFSAEYEISYAVCGQRAAETRCGRD